MWKGFYFVAIQLKKKTQSYVIFNYDKGNEIQRNICVKFFFNDNFISVKQSKRLWRTETSNS